MNNIILLALSVVILIVIITIYKVSKKNKQDEKTIQLTKEIKEKLAKTKIDSDNMPEKSISASELINNKGAVKKASKSGNGIINKPAIVNKNKKALNWTESTSYEDDIKKVDIDSFLLNNLDVVEEKNTKITFKPLILLVDDSMVVRKYVGDLLKKNNYDLIIKNDGKEAYTYLTEGLNDVKYRKPELIISDIEMPNMNGIELIEEVRKIRSYNSTPILVISAHAESHLKLLENENIEGFIRKPFNDSDLLTQCDYLINQA